MPGWVRFLLAYGLRVTVVGFVAIVGVLTVLVWFGRDLPPVGQLAYETRPAQITILDRYGVEIGVHGDDYGDPVQASDLPDHVINAFLATEDRNFYHHIGVNPIAILRALTVNVREGGVTQGGSTITQQLVKNVFLTPERTLERKAQEVLLSLKIEMMYPKEEILSAYLNNVYFGNGAYGIEAASRRYFGISPNELSIGQAAMLAGLLKAPSRLAPTSNEQGARERAEVVLGAMVDAGALTAAERADVQSTGIATPIRQDQRLSYAINYAVDEAERVLGSFEEDIIIRTTIDREAIRSIGAQRATIAASDPLYTNDIEAAILVLEEDGAIRVMIGGNEYGSSVFNRATQARRSPGSVFKPFVYLAALEAGWYPEDRIDDAPITVGEYTPDNYRDRYYGPVPLSEALSRSLNAAAIRLQEEVGRDHVVDVARRAGFPSISNIGPALALGVVDASAIEVATGFLPLSNGGYAATPYMVQSIQSEAGQTLFDRPEMDRETSVFAAEDLNALDYMLRSVVNGGSGFRARVDGHHAAGKTGTTQDSRDAWFAGYASGLVGVVWLGKDDNTPMDNGTDYISGSGAPARLWSAAMTTSLDGRSPRPPRPYRPRPTNLLEHLAGILGRSEPKEPEPEDELSELIHEVAGYSEEVVWP